MRSSPKQKSLPSPPRTAVGHVIHKCRITRCSRSLSNPHVPIFVQPYAALYGNLLSSVGDRGLVVAVGAITNGPDPLLQVYYLFPRKSTMLLFLLDTYLSLVGTRRL
jgi:hypothetical protein